MGVFWNLFDNCSKDNSYHLVILDIFGENFRNIRFNYFIFFLITTSFLINFFNIVG